MGDAFPDEGEEKKSKGGLKAGPLVKHERSSSNPPSVRYREICQQRVNESEKSVKGTHICQANMAIAEDSLDMMRRV